MGEELPLTYQELEKLILNERETRKQNNKAPIVSWQEFIKLGAMANMKDEEALARAAGLFHDLVSTVGGNSGVTFG